MEFSCMKRQKGKVVSNLNSLNVVNIYIVHFIRVEL